MCLLLSPPALSPWKGLTDTPGDEITGLLYVFPVFRGLCCPRRGGQKWTSAMALRCMSRELPCLLPWFRRGIYVFILHPHPLPAVFLSLVNRSQCLTDQASLKTSVSAAPKSLQKRTVKCERCHPDRIPPWLCWLLHQRAGKSVVKLPANSLE